MAGEFNKELCDSTRAVVMKHDKEIYGNGLTGLKTKVEKFDEFREDFKQVFSNFATQITTRLIYAIITLILISAAQLVYFTVKIENLEKKPNQIQQSGSSVQLSDK